MKTLIALAVALAATLVSGCATTPDAHRPEPALQTQYDFAIYAAGSDQPLSVAALALQLSEADVVVVGEFHGHQASHLLQSALQTALFSQNPRQILSMEQFEVDKQSQLDRYLAGETGETELVEDADAWSNYRASYRPLIEFARLNQLPVIAANAPGDTVRCVGRQGIDYLTTLPADQRRSLPEPPLTDTPDYRDKFFSVMSQGHGGSKHSTSDAISERMKNTYQAQLLRDNTMAQQILDANQRYPSHQIFHVTGTFHSERRLGTVAVVEKQRPELKVAVISPVIVEPDAAQTRQTLADVAKQRRDKGDYLYLILPLPEKFKDAERQREAMMAQFKGTATDTCN